MTQKKHPSPQRQPSAMDRLQALEARHNILVARTQKAFQAVDQRIAVCERTLSAVIEIVGTEEVQRHVESQLKKEQEDRADENETAIKEAVEKGQLKEVDAIDGDDTLIVLQEKDESGKAVGPSRVFISLGGFDNQPEVKAALVDKKKGDVVEVANKHTATILGCYKPVAPSEQSTPEVLQEGEEVTADVSPQEEVQGPKDEA